MLLIPIRGRRICPAGSPGRGAARPWCGREVPDDVFVRRARRGCRSARAELADRHGPLAYRVALRLLGDRQDAADLTREALVLHHFEGLSHDQVALITASTVPAVRRDLIQARRAVARAAV
jgi:DNA-directed RNA polymerase specialized sigma24 family protein